MRLAIIGSRNFNNHELFKEVMNEYVGEVRVVVSGGAKGADTLGEVWAKQNNKDTLIFKPDWNRFGKSAGFIRNQDIVKNSDLVLAFWDGQSKGTKSSIDLCEKFGIPTKIIYYNEVKNNS